MEKLIFNIYLRLLIFGYKLTVMSIQAFIHGVFPWCFEHTVSNKIKKLNDVLQKRKDSQNNFFLNMLV